ncbi:putative addiction module antitoxin [Legionella fallonii LLAP-10]|uniref:Putative addiction module antitoxin n=2 Tax=Legionella fallonii TaxID=96230 RepID=A0A098G1U7_9GAMM|nr:putative addiction module antitoxin [Legionella fallonii LLAP-10]
MDWLMTMNLTIKQSNSFKKTVRKLPKQHKAILDEEVRKLVNNPVLGERKKGDLDFLRVHKFKLLNQEVLLGYMFEEDEIILTLLKLGTHENFYRDIKNNI